MPDLAFLTVIPGLTIPTVMPALTIPTVMPAPEPASMYRVIPTVIGSRVRPGMTE
jgi:hypothetical protein